MRTAGPPPPWPVGRVQPLWAAIDDDLLNQLGFAFWQTGLVTRWSWTLSCWVDCPVVIPPPLGYCLESSLDEPRFAAHLGAGDGRWVGCSIGHR